MSSAIEVLKREKKYMKLHCGAISNGQWIPRDLRLAFDEALLALEKQKLVWVLFCEEDCEGGMILGIYRNYEDGRKELERLAEKEGGVIKDDSYRCGVSVTSLSSYPVFLNDKVGEQK